MRGRLCLIGLLLSAAPIHAASGDSGILRKGIGLVQTLDSDGYRLRLLPDERPMPLQDATMRHGVDTVVTGSLSAEGATLRSTTSNPHTGHKWSWESEPEIRGPLIAALDRSPALRAAVSDIDVAKARTFRAIAAFLPTVTGSTTTVLYSSGQTNTIDDNYSTGSISVSMPLFTSGQNWNALKSAKASERAVRFSARAEASNVILDVLAAFIEADFAKVQATIAQGNLSTLRALQGSVAKRAKAGFASNADLADIDASLAAAERQLEAAKGALALAQDSLRLSTGKQGAAGSINLKSLEAFFSKGKAGLIASARAGSNVIAAARERANAAEFQKRAAFGKYLPRVDLAGEYTKVLEQNSTGSIDPNRFSVQVKLRVPIVDFNVMADVKEARALAASAHYRAQDAEFEVEKRISADWESYTSKKRQLQIAAKEVAAANRSLTSRQRQFEAGLINADNVATQVQNAADARLAEAQLRAEVRIIMARIASEAGLFGSNLPSPD